MARATRIEGIFRDITANRREAAAGTCEAGVFGVKKDGTLYAKPSATFRSLEEAENRAATMMTYEGNAGKTFIAKAL